MTVPELPAAQSHWQDVYRHKDPAALSWFRPHLERSLALLQRAGLGPSSRVIDVGGGASTLVDDLLQLGVSDITVLDLSDAALAHVRPRLGERGSAVHWRVGDLRTVPLQVGRYDLWHDRAVLHFLIDAADVQAYARQAAHAIAPGGHAVIAGFAPGGPERCSGLRVARRSAQDIAAALGGDFELVAEEAELHHSPGGAEQAFAYALLRRR